MAITQAAEFLATWETGLDGAARPDLGGDRQALLSLPVGQREADLFALRRALFGERMQVRLECAACGADMEFELDAGQLAGSLGGLGGLGESVVRVQQDGWNV